MVIPLSSSATLDWFSSLSPFGQADKGLSPALWISTIEQLLSSNHALYLTLSRLAEISILKWNGYKAGLVDIYASIAGKVFDGSWTVAVHDYSVDKATDTVDDLGREVNVVYTKKFAKNYTADIKYATYSAGDFATGKVDTDKF